MAKEPTLTELIDQSLRYDHAMLDELVEVTDEWDELPEGERVSWMLDWDQFALMKLPRIAGRYARGAMTAEQEDEYRRLIKRIEQYSELIRQYGLTMPRIPVET